MAWPKGVPKKGYKESGMSLEGWIAHHKKGNGVASLPKPQKKVDKTPTSIYEYYCRKDEWGRVFIHIRKSLEGLVLKRRVRSEFPITEAYELAIELKL